MLSSREFFVLAEITQQKSQHIFPNNETCSLIPIDAAEDILLSETVQQMMFPYPQIKGGQYPAKSHAFFWYPRQEVS